MGSTCEYWPYRGHEIGLGQGFYFSRPFISNVIEDEDSFDLREHSNGILLLLIKGEHCLEKREINLRFQLFI